MAEPHSPPPEEQAVPGTILDEAPFFSIADFKRFAVRLSILRAKVGQHIMHTHTTHTRPNEQYIIVRTEYIKSTTLGD